MHIFCIFRIGVLQDDLKSSLENCEDAINHVKLAKRHITTAGLGLLGYCKKKSLILNLLSSLNSIKMLVRYSNLYTIKQIAFNCSQMYTFSCKLKKKLKN